MNSQILGLRITSIVLGFISLAQLARFVLRVEVIVAGFQVPQWPSALAFIFLGGLSFWLCKIAQLQQK